MARSSTNWVLTSPSIPLMRMQRRVPTPGCFVTTMIPTLVFQEIVALIPINPVSGILTFAAADKLTIMDTLSRYQVMMCRGRLAIYQKPMSRLHHVSVPCFSQELAEDKNKIRLRRVIRYCKFC